ncbi:MAG: hypothetical protein HC906_18335 [Bacteroidales bacterium]|nr:hypothetical protein [Bacteroidales bacterium]
MNDTPEEIRLIQHNIFMAMSPLERFKIGLQMAQDGMEMMKKGIIMEKGPLNEQDLKIEVIRRLRRHDPTLSWIDEIIGK